MFYMGYLVGRFVLMYLQIMCIVDTVVLGLIYLVDVVFFDLPPIQSFLGYGWCFDCVSNCTNDLFHVLILFLRISTLLSLPCIILFLFLSFFPLS